MLRPRLLSRSLSSSAASSQLFGSLRAPVIAAPMFILSNPDLVLAQCKAGIVGSFPALNARPKELLDEWLTQITAELAAHNVAHPDRPAAPFAVNQIVHKSNVRLMHDLELCVKHKVPIVITSLGARKDVNDAIHSYGGIVLHDVLRLRPQHQQPARTAHRRSTAAHHLRDQHRRHHLCAHRLRRLIAR